MPEKKRYKIMRARLDGKTFDLWSVGYPTKSAAQAAARRLNGNSRGGVFKVAEMTPADYDIMNDLMEGDGG